MKKLLAATMLMTAGLSMSAHAGFISGTQYTDGGKAVALQGLEWMPLTYTAGLTADEVLSSTGFTDRFGSIWKSSDWRVASRDETETLLTSLWGGVYNGVSKDNGDGASWFLKNFGALRYDTGYGVNRVSLSYSDDMWNSFDSTRFMFGNTGECNISTTICVGYISSALNFAGNMYAYNVKTSTGEISYKANTGLIGTFANSGGVKMDTWAENEAISRNSSSSEYGILLVRTPSQNPTASVSAPGAFGLLALGLSGLALTRRRKSAK